MSRQETLQAIQETLERLDTEALESLLTFIRHVPKRLSAAGVPYTGDPETDAVLDEHPDILERIRRLERGEETLIPWEEVKARQRAKRNLQ